MFASRNSLAIFLFAVFQLAGCATYQVEPGEVIVKRFAETPEGSAESLEMPQVTGTFALRSDPHGDGPTRLSTGAARNGVTGGACLIFRAVENRKACSTPADCELVTGANNAAESTLKGYCLANESSEDLPGSPLPAKLCWFKKGDPCVKSPIEVLTLDKVVQLPTVDAFPLGRNKPMLWRVISCQNLTDFGCANPTAQEGIDWRIRSGAVAMVE
jgi:hypothetical protein